MREHVRLQASELHCALPEYAYFFYQSYKFVFLGELFMACA